MELEGERVSDRVSDSAEGGACFRWDREDQGREADRNIGALSSELGVTRVEPLRGSRKMPNCWCPGLAHSGGQAGVRSGREQSPGRSAGDCINRRHRARAQEESVEGHPGQSEETQES